MTAGWAAWNIVGEIWEHCISQKFQKSLVFVVVALEVLIGNDVFYISRDDGNGANDINQVVAINETLVAFHLLNPSANFDQRIFDRIHDPPCQWQLELRQHMAQTQLANCTFQQEVAQIDITLMLCKFSSLQVPFNCLSSPERNRLCNDPARCSACSNRPLIFVSPSQSRSKNALA